MAKTTTAVKAKTTSTKAKAVKSAPVVEEIEEEIELTPAQRKKLAKQIAADEKPVTKKAKTTKKAKAVVVSSRNANPEYRTRECLGEEYPLEAQATLEQSVGRQALHCLTVAGQKKNPVFKSAQTLYTTGALAETKIRALRDVIREHMPDAEEDEQEAVLAKRCCRGLGMVIARMDSEDEE